MFSKLGNNFLRNSYGSHFPFTVHNIHLSMVIYYHIYITDSCEDKLPSDSRREGRGVRPNLMQTSVGVHDYKEILPPLNADSSGMRANASPSMTAIQPNPEV
jgi:hypothetical protein